MALATIEAPSYEEAHIAQQTECNVLMQLAMELENQNRVLMLDRENKEEELCRVYQVMQMKNHEMDRLEFQLEHAQTVIQKLEKKQAFYMQWVEEWRKSQCLLPKKPSHELRYTEIQQPYKKENRLAQWWRKTFSKKETRLTMYC